MSASDGRRHAAVPLLHGNASPRMLPPPPPPPPLPTQVLLSATVLVVAFVFAYAYANIPPDIRNAYL